MNHSLSVCLIAAAISSGCTHYYEGTVAELEQTPDLKVVLAASAYGDCFRSDQEVPIVYAVMRPGYSLRIAHGMRYWPEFFLIAHDANGAMLNIRGAGIRPVEYPRGGDMRRLREARGTDLSHHAMLAKPHGWDGSILEDETVEAIREGIIVGETLTFEVEDSAGLVLGQEEFRYRISTIRCREFDGP